MCVAWLGLAPPESHTEELKLLFTDIAVKCFAFCPAVVASAAFHDALLSAPQLSITSIVVSHDIVPRLSHESIVRFVEELLHAKGSPLPEDPMQVVGSRVLHCRREEGVLLFHEVQAKHMDSLRSIHLRRSTLSAHSIEDLERSIMSSA